MSEPTTAPADINGWANHLTRRLDVVEDTVTKLAAHRDEERNPAISAANTLIQLLGELRHVRSELRELGAALSVKERSSESRSSIEIKTSPRGHDITTKLYEGSPTDGLVDQAIAMYGEAFRRVQAESLNGWSETLAAGKPGGWAS